MGNWWTDHPDLEGVARRGRSELQDEAVAAEADTEHLRQRRRRLVDVCFEWMSRGDRISVAVADARFEGKLTAAVNDLLVIETKTLVVSVNLESVIYVRSDRKAEFAGTSGERSASTFRAQLGRYEVDAAPVRLVGANLDVTGVIRASTDDHVALQDSQGTGWAVPWRSIGYALGATPE